MSEELVQFVVVGLSGILAGLGVGLVVHLYVVSPCLTEGDVSVVVRH